MEMSLLQIAVEKVKSELEQTIRTATYKTVVFPPILRPISISYHR